MFSVQSYFCIIFWVHIMFLFMFSELLSGGTDRNDRAWRDGRLWHGQKSYDRNVHSNGIPDGAGFLETQGQILSVLQMEQKTKFSLEKQRKVKGSVIWQKSVCWEPEAGEPHFPFF